MTNKKKTNYSQKRKGIPGETKRLVRQQCKFGCVLCSCPIYDYHHINENRDDNRVDNLVLLCPTHHREVTTKQISNIDFKKKIEALSMRSLSDSRKIFYKENMSIKIGNNTVYSQRNNAFFMFNFLDKNYFFIKNKNGESIICAQLTDANNNIAFSIKESRYQFYNNYWDIEYKGNCLTFREQRGDVFLKIKFDTENNAISIDKAKIYVLPEMPIVIDESGILLGKNTVISNLKFINNSYGIAVYGNNEKKSTQVCAINSRIDNSLALNGEIGLGWNINQYKRNFTEV